MGRRPGVPTIRLHPGRVVYTCRFTAHGVRYDDVSTGERDPERALEAALRLQAEALLRRAPQRRKRVRHADQESLAVLSALYLEHVEASGRASSYARKQQQHFHAHILPRWSRLSELTSTAIASYATERARETTQRKRAPSTVSVYKELVTLSSFLRWCVRAGYLDAVPVIERPRPVSDYKPPDLSREDVERVLAELPTRRTHPKRYAARERYTVQWAQGMRDGEVASLRWSDVDLDGGTITIRQSADKARVGRVLALSAPARAVLAELAREPRLPSGLVFGRADLRVALDAACARAGVERITTHGFRHARLTELAGATHDTAAIQYLAGHRSLATTDRYVRSRTTRTAALLEAVDSKPSERSRRDARAPRRGARGRPLRE